MRHRKPLQILKTKQRRASQQRLGGHLPADVEMVMPGENITMDVELITPIAIEEGLRFAIREGGRTVGSGIVAKVIESQ